MGTAKRCAADPGPRLNANFWTPGLQRTAPQSRRCAALRPGHVAALREPDHRAVQVVGVGALDLHGRDLAHAQRPPGAHMHRAVDLRGVAAAAALGAGRTDRVDDDRLARADLALQALGRDRLLALHESVPALLLDGVG